MYKTYFKIFLAMGLKPIALRADTGAIGGDLSHEFHILAEVGESGVFYDAKLEEIYQNISCDSEIEIDKLQKIYAMTDDLHDPSKCNVPIDQLKSKRGIEVGQIFNFNDKYSRPMEASVMGINGEKIYPNMGSYGIGVSRVVSASIEANHDQYGIIWPKPIAPFTVILINIRNNDLECQKACEKIYHDLLRNNIEVLYDDTAVSLGQKMAIADLIGIPTQIIIGPKSLAQNLVEIKDRKTQKKTEIPADDIYKFI
jgi:prolyl-tRNA synthetase